MTVAPPVRFLKADQFHNRTETLSWDPSRSAAGEPQPLYAAIDSRGTLMSGPRAKRLWCFPW